MLNRRTILSKEILKTLEQSVDFIKEQFKLDIQIYENKIPISVKTGEAILNKKSVIEYRPNNPVAIAYKDFAQEWREE